MEEMVWILFGCTHDDGDCLERVLGVFYDEETAKNEMNKLIKNVKTKKIKEEFYVTEYPVGRLTDTCKTIYH